MLRVSEQTGRPEVRPGRTLRGDPQLFAPPLAPATAAAPIAPSQGPLYADPTRFDE